MDRIDDVFFLFKKLNYYESCKDYKSVLYYCNKLLDSGFVVSTFYIKKATALYHLNKPHDALSCCDSAIKLNPKDWKSYYRKAQIYNALNKHKDAIDSYNCVLNINPSHEFSRLNLGNLYYQNVKDYDMALDCFDIAIEMNPKSEYGYYFRGCLLKDMECYKIAIRDFSLSITFNSSNTMAFYLRGACFFAINKYKSAMQDFKIAKMLDDKIKIPDDFFYFAT